MDVPLLLLPLMLLAQASMSMSRSKSLRTLKHLNAFSLKGAEPLSLASPLLYTDKRVAPSTSTALGINALLLHAAAVAATHATAAAAAAAAAAVCRCCCATAAGFQGGFNSQLESKAAFKHDSDTMSGVSTRSDTLVQLCLRSLRPPG